MSTTSKSASGSKRRSQSAAEVSAIMSEVNKQFLETVGKFCIRAKHSTWENVNHVNETEAVALLKELSPQLTPSEYRGLCDGWSDYRLNGTENMLNDAVMAITDRIQGKTDRLH